MDFIEPKNINKKSMSWNISYKTRLIVEYYSKYTGYDEDEIVDDFLRNLLEDPKFIKWLNNRKSKKKITEILLKADKRNTEIIDKAEDF